MKNTCLLLLLFCALPALARKKVEEPTVPPMTVQRLSNSTVIDTDDFAYVLPRTVLRIKITLQRTQFTRGVYAEYADKYLGISDVKKKDAQQYLLKSIDVTPLQEVDPDEIYVVHSAQNVPSAFFKMQEMGLTLGLPLPQNNTPSATAMPASDWAIPPFTNMGYKVGAFETPASRKATPPDTNADPLKTLPVVPNNSPAPKSKDAQAAEAAKTLTGLRRRRLELITAEIEAVFVNGEALKAALAEIKDVERQYLELFVGKVQSTEAEYFYDIVPEKGKDRYPLFSFSSEKGITPETQENITLHLQCAAPFAAPEINSAAYKYRIPCISDMRITEGDEELFTGRYAIFQFGQLISLFP